MAPVFAHDISPPDLSRGKTVISDESGSLKLPVTCQIIFAQQEDLSLRKCLSAAVPLEEANKTKSAYFIKNDLLMRRWCSDVADDSEWNVVYQIVIPSGYRQQIVTSTRS